MTFLAVQCERCKTVQAPAPQCRRCERKLPDAVCFVGLPPSSVEPVHLMEALPTVEEMEIQLIREALRRAAGNGPRAARMIGIGKTTLYRKAQQHGIQTQRQKAQVTQ